MKYRCERCEREFLPNRIWQRFCSRDCQQKWNHDRYRTQRVELGQMLRDKLTVTEGIVEPLIERAEQREHRMRVQQLSGKVARRF